MNKYYTIHKIQVMLSDLDEKKVDSIYDIVEALYDRKYSEELE